MRFVVTMKDENRDPKAPLDPKLMMELGKFATEMSQAGKVVVTGGLSPRAIELKAAGGNLSVVDGPFVETKELIAGWVVLEVASKAEALELTTRFMKLHQDILGPSWEATAEMRQIVGGDDVVPPTP
jgi:hypothetical protein